MERMEKVDDIEIRVQKSATSASIGTCYLLVPQDIAKLIMKRLGIKGDDIKTEMFISPTKNEISDKDTKLIRLIYEIKIKGDK